MVPELLGYGAPVMIDTPMADSVGSGEKIAAASERTGTTDPETFRAGGLRAESEDEARAIPPWCPGCFEAQVRPYAVAPPGSPGPFAPG